MPDEVAVADSLLDPESKPGTQFPRGIRRDEPAAATIAVGLRHICQLRHPAPPAPATLPIITAEEAATAARRLLLELSDVEFDVRWLRIELCVARHALFAHPSGAACAQAVLPSEEVLTVEDALGRMPPDEEGHPDWRVYADALAEEWGRLADLTIEEASLAVLSARLEPV